MGTHSDWQRHILLAFSWVTTMQTSVQALSWTQNNPPSTTRTGPLGKELTNPTVTRKQRIAMFFSNEPITMKNTKIENPTKCEVLRTSQEILPFGWLVSPEVSVVRISRVIARLSVILKNTVVGDWRFDNGTEDHLQSQVFVSRRCYKSGTLNVISEFRHDGIGWKTRVKFVISH